ncbi:MAG: hypothetical protein NT003_02935 [Candidatus Magasanikbacteria bacterium]|nr:hypothetical protein [Candidatus Magasanikbacteria bacterium]
MPTQTIPAVVLDGGTTIRLSKVQYYMYQWVNIFAHRLYVEVRNGATTLHTDLETRPRRVREIATIDLSNIQGGAQSNSILIIEFKDGGVVALAFKYLSIQGFAAKMLWPVRAVLQDRMLADPRTYTLQRSSELREVIVGEGEEFELISRMLQPFVADYV